MACAVILDVETTGLDAPDVIELACTAPIASPDLAEITDALCTTYRFRPSKPISLGALATHHILDSDLTEETPWPGKWTPPAGVEYVVAQNVDFDHKAIGSPHLARICTLALARSLWPDVDSHRLEAMTYYLRGRNHETREILRGAHSAATDLMLCAWLLVEILKMLPGTMSWHQLWMASERARVPTRMPVGKHKGLPIKDVPRDYCAWFLRQPDVDPYLAKALRGEAS